LQYAAAVARGPHRLFFDLWSLVYDAPGVQRVTYRPVQDAVVRALRTDPPARVLDVGCGTGRLGVRLSREIPRTHVTGCDLSRGMLNHALARGRALAWVHVAAASGCPSPTAPSTTLSRRRPSTGSRIPTRRSPDSVGCSHRAVACWSPS
jgi:SAM-dependent methyltransferase